MIFHALAVHGDEAAVDDGLELLGIREGPVGEVAALEIALGAFDMVELGCVFRQLLDGEPGSLAERLVH